MQLYDVDPEVCMVLIFYTDLQAEFTIDFKYLQL